MRRVRTSACCETCAFIFSSGQQDASTMYQPPGGRLVDIEQMPGYDPAAITTKVKGGIRSVSEGRVRYGDLQWMDADARATVICRVHGACLCVGSSEAGKLWRCTACGEGAWQVGIEPPVEEEAA